MSPAALSALLADEEALLERLHYRLAQLALLAATGRHTYLAAAADEANDLADDLGGLELARALMVAELAAAWGAATDQPTLAELCDLAPPDWRPILAGYLDRLRALQGAITAITGTGTAHVDEALARLADLAERVEHRTSGFEGAGAGYSLAGSAGGGLRIG